MNRKRAVDSSISLIFIAVWIIAGVYREQVRESAYLMWGAGAAAVVFLLLAVKDRGSAKKSVGRGRMQLPAEVPSILEAALLSEEDTELMTWTMYGKSALVIGRDKKDNQVDIDLKESPFAGMVEGEHAVLNFSAGGWFVEDLGSANGLRIRKDDGRVYQLAADTPCRVERGDCLYVGENRLLFR